MSLPLIVKYTIRPHLTLGGFNNWLFLIGIILWVTPMAGQKTLTFNPKMEDDAPSWVRLMYQEDPNVWEVDQAYREYYEVHDFTKTMHTQYYKKWRRKVESYINAAGEVVLPSLSRQQEKENTWLEHWSKNILSKDGVNGAPWTSLGPFQTLSTNDGQLAVSWQANVYAIDQSSSDPNVLYCGTEAGGVFKTLDKGIHWQHASFNSLLASVTAVKIHPTNPDIVYSGDGNHLYKTENGGVNWEKILSRGGLRVNTIAIHPQQPNIILVASYEGLFRSQDGGDTWDQLYTDKCWDLAIHPTNPSIIYLLKNDPAQKKCVFLKSTNQGLNFSPKESGWYASTHPDRRDDGARMTVTPMDPDRVYVVLIGAAKPGDNGFIGVFKTMDAGENWTLPNSPVGGPYTNSHPNLMTLNNTNTLYQGYYNLGIAASHTNPDHVLIGGLNLWKTEDGAESFTPIGGYQGNVPWIHPDQQEILVLGNDMWVANDGGINYSTNLFQTHESRINGLYASDFWGFGSGWNEDLVVGGRYHNGNTAYRPSFPDGQFLRLGGAEAPTGYVNPGIPGRAYFSDINTQSIPNLISGEVFSFPPLSKYPSESFYAAHSSELEFDPYSYKTFYIGEGANLWRSEDEGLSYDLIKSFGNGDQPILHIEISRTDPAVIYVYQRFSFYNARLWKTIDGGETWSALDFPAANSQRAGTMSLSATDSQTLWVAFGHQDNDGTKVFKTTDGGLSWENLSTPILDGHRIHHVLHQAGTNGAVYLASNFGVFYRDDSLTDWEIFCEGLPARTNGNLLRPFYKAGKMRMATYGSGIWEVDFKQPSLPIAQPTVDKRKGACARDTFYFEDFSILNHTNASWEWSFPGAIYVSATTVRNPKVVFGQEGSFDVSLTVTNDIGSHTKTISNMVEIAADACSPDPKAGLALKLNGGSADLASSSPLNLQSNTVTFSAWIKRNGSQNPNSAILFCRGETTTAGINFGDHNELRYHWNDSQWWWDSGLVVPDEEWTHIALVITPDRAIIYLNGEPSVNASSHPKEAFDSPFIIGGDPNFNSRRMKGQIEEVCVWNRALSQEEIRDFRHLIKKPADDDSLVLYYQFNEEKGEALDKVGLRHAAIGGSSTRLTSTCPVGEGTSYRITVADGGEKLFPETGISIEFPETGLFPQGEVVVSRLNQSPDQTANEDAQTEAYWVINNYGGNEQFDELKRISFQGIGEISEEEASAPNSISLYIRGENADGPTWEQLDLADEVQAGANGLVVFSEENSVKRFGQFTLSRSGMPTASVQQEKLPAPFIIYPNPVRASQEFHIDTERLDKFVFTLYSMDGKRVYRKELQGNSVINGVTLPSGGYFYQLATKNQLFYGKLSIE